MNLEHGKDWVWSLSWMYNFLALKWLKTSIAKCSPDQAFERHQEGSCGLYASKRIEEVGPCYGSRAWRFASSHSPPSPACTQICLDIMSAFAIWWNLVLFMNILYSVSLFLKQHQVYLDNEAWARPRHDVCLAFRPANHVITWLKNICSPKIRKKLYRCPDMIQSLKYARATIRSIDAAALVHLFGDLTLQNKAREVFERALNCCYVATLGCHNHGSCKSCLSSIPSYTLWTFLHPIS